MQFFHLVNTYKSKNKEEQQRNAFAQQTWELCKDLIPNYIDIKDLTRNSQTELNDSRSVPFVTDLIDEAVKNKKETDVIVFTNTDICFAKDLIDEIKRQTNSLEKECAYGARHEFDRDLESPLETSTDIKKLLKHTVLGGGDIFVFTVNWWQRNRNRMKDYVLGCQWWDTALQKIMDTYKCPVLKNVIYHRTHHSFWYQGSNQTENKGQQHNYKLAKEDGLVQLPRTIIPAGAVSVKNSKAVTKIKKVQYAV